MSKIPNYIKGRWPLGCLGEIRKDPIQFGMSVALDNPPLVKVRILGGSIYYTADADVAHEILVSSSKLINRGSNYKALEKLTGQGLFSTDGEVWKFRRKAMQPAMAHGHYDKYLQIFESIADDFEKSWLEKDNQQVRMADEMSIFTIRAIGLSLFSIDLYEKHPGIIQDLFYLMRFINLRYYDWVKIPLWVPKPEHIRFKRTLAKLNKVLFDVIKNRREAGVRQDDMLDLLIEAEYESTGETLSDSQIRDEVLTIISAGFKTSSATLSWIWYQFGKHPDVLRKVRAEVKGVIGAEKINSRNLHDLKYTRCVINEALRMCPSAFAVSRNFNSDVAEFAGYQVESNSRVITSIFGLHYNPKFWENPHEFNPDRFIDNEKEFKRRGIFIPFGAGSRICLGAEFSMLEMLTVIVRLAPKFNPICHSDYTPKMIAAIAIQFSEEMPMIMRKEVY